MVRRKKHSKQSDVINMTDFVCQLQEVIDVIAYEFKVVKSNIRCTRITQEKGSTG